MFYVSEIKEYLTCAIDHVAEINEYFTCAIDHVAVVSVPVRQRPVTINTLK